MRNIEINESDFSKLKQTLLEKEEFSREVQSEIYHLTDLLFQKLGLKDRASEDDRRMIYRAIRSAAFEYYKEDREYRSSLNETQKEIKNLKKEYEEETENYLKDEIQEELGVKNKKLLKLTKERKVLSESGFLKLIRESITETFNESVALRIKKSI